jgi:hypothetical protein
VTGAIWARLHSWAAHIATVVLFGFLQAKVLDVWALIVCRLRFDIIAGMLCLNGAWRSEGCRQSHAAENNQKELHDCKEMVWIQRERQTCDAKQEH